MLGGGVRGNRWNASLGLPLRQGLVAGDKARDRQWIRVAQRRAKGVRLAEWGSGFARPRINAGLLPLGQSPSRQEFRRDRRGGPFGRRGCCTPATAGGGPRGASSAASSSGGGGQEPSRRGLHPYLGARPRLRRWWLWEGARSPPGRCGRRGVERRVGETVPLQLRVQPAAAQWRRRGVAR
jgi:hypothetical protein